MNSLNTLMAIMYLFSILYIHMYSCIQRFNYIAGYRHSNIVTISYFRVQKPSCFFYSRIQTLLTVTVQDTDTHSWFLYNIFQVTETQSWLLSYIPRHRQSWLLTNISGYRNSTMATISYSRVKSQTYGCYLIFQDTDTYS